MKKGAIFTLAFLLVGAGAFAVNTDTHFTGPSNGSGEAYDLGLKDVLVDNLCTSSGQISNGYSAFAGGGYDRWIAFDYTAPEGSDWNVEDLHLHVLWDSGYHPGDMNVIFYEDIPGGDIVISFSVDEEDLTITDTGMVAFSRTVWLVEFEFECVMLTGGGYYWIAVQMDTAGNNLFFAVREDSIVEDYCWWKGDSGIWQSSYDAFLEYSEMSYALTGYEVPTAVVPSSVGQIKSLFN